MDPKELKALLKEAKTGLKSKDYDTTVKNCKLVIKKVPGNYDSHLFLGTAMMEQAKYQQALECFKKAIEIDKVKIFAWQGVVRTYEKQGIKDHVDLLDAYKTVATHFELSNDVQKYLESTKKLITSLIVREDNRSALKVLIRIAKSYPLDLDMSHMVERILSKTTFDTRSEPENGLFTQALGNIVNETKGARPSEDIYKRYFTQLNRCGLFDDVVNQALKIRDKWNTYSSPMEWLCRYYLEERLDSSALQRIGPFDSLTDRLFKLYPSSTYGHFARGKFLIEDARKMTEGFTFISTGLESKFLLEAVKLLIRGKLDFGDFDGALELAQNALLKGIAAEERNFRRFVTEAYIWLEIEKAEELLENLKTEEEDKEWFRLQLHLQVKKLDFDGVKKYLKKAEALNIRHWLVDFCLLLNDLQNLPNSLTALSQSLTKPDWYHVQLEAAILLFNLKEYKASGDILTKLTTETRDHPIPWKYLAKLYGLQGDSEVEGKCYKKSYKLCASVDVGILLSDAYFNLGKVEENKELLTSATKEFGKSKSKWAWLRLGILYLECGEANEAVVALQAAIRADIIDSNVWEALADAYFLRGSYSAAFNSYTRALELGADPKYPKLKIGVVYQYLGQHEDSIETLKSLIAEYPGKSTAVLIELARTYSIIAQNLCAENFGILSREAVEHSLAYSVIALLTSPRRLLLPWQIIGEGALMLKDLSASTQVKVPSVLLGEEQQATNVEELHYEMIPLEKLREIGIQCLLECLHDPKVRASPTLEAYFYHQLALLYFYRAKTAVECGDDGKSKEMYKKATVAAMKAVVKNRDHSFYWNSLGVISYFTRNNGLAQHSFIKSLEIEKNNVVGWCNLGVFYLLKDETLLAHAMFNKAQSASPLYAISWVGQGLVAEKVQPVESADLFRHASHLEPNPQATLFYTDWIIRIYLKEIELSDTDRSFIIGSVDSLIIVSDLITRVEARMRTPHLYNMKGIIAAMNGFYRTALESFSVALELSQRPSSGVSDADIKRILFNKISMLTKVEKYEEAVELFSTVENLDEVEFGIGALLMSKMKYFDQAEALYEQRLMTSSSDKLNVTLALAIVKNVNHGPEAALKLLLKDEMVQNPHALITLAVLALCNDDADFLSKVMPHLEPFENEEATVADIGLIRACFHIMNKSPYRAVRGLLQMIHRSPLNSRLWTVLSHIVFHYSMDTIAPSTFKTIALSALKLDGTTSSSRDSRSSAVIPLCYLMNNDWRTAINAALLGIRKYPEERENFVVLACAFWYQFVETKEENLYYKVVQLLMRELDLAWLKPRTEEWVKTFLTLIEQYKP